MSEVKNSTTDIDNNVQVSVQADLDYLVQVENFTKSFWPIYVIEKSQA